MGRNPGDTHTVPPLNQKENHTMADKKKTERPELTEGGRNLEGKIQCTLDAGQTKEYQAVQDALEKRAGFRPGDTQFLREVVKRGLAAYRQEGVK